ncbi:MAG: hypothetical protein K9G70_09785 [Prolixibacteraceae bacterium]|nr:hypothetical protein [Prolixibacteraceae bacterium]
MERTNFFEELKRHFDKSSDEQILKEWKESEEFDNIGPTIDEFLSYANTYYKTILEDPLSSEKIKNNNNLSSEFTSSFFLQFKLNHNAKSCIFN